MLSVMPAQAGIQLTVAVSGFRHSPAWRKDQGHEDQDLFEVSKRFGTTVEAIKEANGLDSSKIKAGATLQIPN